MTKELQPHQQRVVVEKAELDGKLTKLTAFFGTEAFANLDDAEMNRLQRQADHMKAYSDVLGERIIAFLTTTCGHCNGSGRMVRDPDIGTDQECFVCDGSGVVEK